MFAPGPAVSEMDTRARQLRRGKIIIRTSGHSSACGTHLRGAWLHARGWWVGGWPKVCVQLALNRTDHTPFSKMRSERSTHYCNHSRRIRCRKVCSSSRLIAVSSPVPFDQIATFAVHSNLHVGPMNVRTLPAPKLTLADTSFLTMHGLDVRARSTVQLQSAYGSTSLPPPDHPSSQ